MKNLLIIIIMLIVFLIGFFVGQGIDDKMTMKELKREQVFLEAVEKLIEEK